MQQNHKEPIDDIKVFWDSAKKTLYSAINEKRNSVQKAIKSARERTYHMCIFIIQNIQQSNNNMHIKQLFDCNKLYQHVTK